MSPPLFNAVLEDVMRKLKVRRRCSKFRIRIGTEPLNSLRCADDLLLIGRCRTQVRHILEELAQEAGTIGPRLHMGKTKILLTCSQRRGCPAQGYVEVSGEKG